MTGDCRFDPCLSDLLICMMHINWNDLKLAREKMIEHKKQTKHRVKIDNYGAYCYDCFWLYNAEFSGSLF